MEVEIVRTLDDWNGDAVLVRREDGRQFVVSTVIAFDTNKMETLAFAADVLGKVHDYGGIAGGIGKTRDETIAELAADELHATIDEWIEECGGPTGAFASAILLQRDAILGMPVSERVDG